MSLVEARENVSWRIKSPAGDPFFDDNPVILKLFEVVVNCLRTDA